MSQKKKQITIVLPDCMADMPVRVVRGNECSEIIVDIRPVDECLMPVEREEPKYALVWKHLGYVKVALDEIEWLEADRGYTVLHLTGGRSMIISFNLSVIRRELPPDNFVQIHRSYVINLMHIESMMGNCVKVGDRLLNIGREYKAAFIGRFIFLGVRKPKK